jgi:hypothetical protein
MRIQFHRWIGFSEDDAKVICGAAAILLLLVSQAAAADRVFSTLKPQDGDSLEIDLVKEAAAVAALQSAGVSVSQAGSAHQATGQVATSGTAGTLVIARATRRNVLVRNLDATNSIYVGPATVTTANGMLLKPGESFTMSFVGLIQVIASAGTPTVAYVDEYD